MQRLLALIPERYRADFTQIARFLVVGAINTGLSYLIYVAVLNFFAAPRAIALVVGYGLGAIFAFFSFGNLVFGGAKPTPERVIRFALGYVVLYLINLGMLNGLISLTGWSEELSQFLLLPAVAATSYLINRLFVFRSSKPRASEN